MMGFRPRLHKDELLWSLLARSCDASGEATKWRFKSHRRICDIALPSEISRLSIADDLEQLDAGRLAVENTIYPYFCGVSRQFFSELVRLAVGPGEVSARKKVNLLIGQLAYKNGVVFCPDCIQESLSSIGYTFLNRAHYLPGVFTCPYHETLLKVSESVSARDLTLEGLTKKCRDLLPVGVDRATSSYLAREASSILANGTATDRFDIETACVELGWISENGTLISNRLLESWRAHYSAEFMSGLGFQFQLDGQQLKKILLGVVGKGKPINPLLGTLLKRLTVVSTGTDPQFDLFGDRRGDYMYCPNPLCELKQAVRLGHDQVCSNCGYHWWVSRKRAVIGKVIDRGHVWKKELQHLLDEQIPLKKIAKLLKASPENVKREALELGYRTLWKKPKERHDYTPSILDLQASRADWLKVRACYQSLSRKELRAQAPALWKWLYRNDRAWLQQNLPPARPSGRSSPDTAALFKGENA